MEFPFVALCNNVGEPQTKDKRPTPTSMLPFIKRMGQHQKSVPGAIVYRET